MALDFKTPEEVAQEYLQTLKTLKPEVNINQTDSDWWVKAQVLGGAMSGIYADQQLLSNDPFPQSARREALGKHLVTYFNESFTPAQQAEGPVRITGASGSEVPENLEGIYDPNGNAYQIIDGGTLLSEAPDGKASGEFVVRSVGAGQDQNLLIGAELTISSPPGGIDPTMTLVGNISDGRNEESNEEAAARILERIRTPLAGGKVSDYKAFARAADPSVVDANVIRFPFGFGTVAIVIKAGTTDIDQALDSGQPVIFEPSEGLIERVQEYIDEQKPVTDCATVLPPQQIPVDVTVRVRYQSGNNSTVLSGQTLTNEELVQREVQRAIYKTPAGGRQFGASGFVVASEIEESIDLNLSGEPYQVGRIIELLLDRRVEDLSATGANLMILGTQIAVPGTITVLEM